MFANGIIFLSSMATFVIGTINLFKVPHTPTGSLFCIQVYLFSFFISVMINIIVVCDVHVRSTEMLTLFLFLLYQLLIVTDIFNCFV